MNKVIIILCLLNFSVMAQSELPIIKGVGGEFNAPSTLGKRISLSEYRDKIVLLTFGYTNCPDICPVTLSYLTALIRDLKKENTEVSTLFVTVDPSYDSPAHLKKYLEYFDKSFVGITGTQVEMDYIADKFLLRRQAVADIKVSTEFRKKRFVKDGVSKDSDKTKLFSHSIYIYLIDKKGRTRSFFEAGTPRSKVVDMIKKLIAEK